MDHPARQVEDEPGVDGSEDEVAGTRCLAGAVHVVEDPLHLSAREVRIGLQAGLRPNRVLEPRAHELVCHGRGAAALPHNSVMDGLTAVAIPHHRGLALVGDADGGDGVGMDAAFELDLHHDGDLGRQDFHRVLLNPTGVRVDVLDVTPRAGDDDAVLVHDERAHGRGARIERHDILRLAGIIVLDKSETLERERHGAPYSFRRPEARGIVSSARLQASAGRPSASKMSFSASAP